MQEIFKHFDFGSRGRVATSDLPNILKLLQHNIGKVEEIELRYEIDKKNKGFFTMKDLTTLLCNTGFEDETQADLIASLRELDDDGDGFIDKHQLGQILCTIGEGLDDSELTQFMELASEPDSDRPDLIDIKKVAEILLPDIETDNHFDKRNNKIGYVK